MPGNCEDTIIHFDQFFFVNIANERNPEQAVNPTCTTSSRICTSAHARLQQPIAETNPAIILPHLYYCFPLTDHCMRIDAILMNEMETRIPVVCPSPKLERRTKYAKRRTRSDNYYRRHASNMPFCTTQLLNYALLPFLNNIIQKLWSTGFVTPIASCEGPRCIPSLSLYVPTTTRTVPSTGCSGNAPRQQMGPTHRGMLQPLARPVTGGRMSKRQSLSALSQSVHPRQQVDL